LIHCSNFNALDAPEAYAAAALGVGAAFGIVEVSGRSVIGGLKFRCCAVRTTTAATNMTTKVTAVAATAASTAAAFGAVELVPKVVAVDVCFALVQVRHDVVVLEVELPACVRYPAVAARANRFEGRVNGKVPELKIPQERKKKKKKKKERTEKDVLNTPF